MKTVVVSGYGLFLAFKASIVLGVVALIVEPAPPVLGVVGLFNSNVCENIAKVLGL